MTGPLIVYGNHPSWWDPLIAHYVNKLLFSPRQFYAPIDASALAKYRVFAKLGFFGIDLGSRCGAVSFLETSDAILNLADTSLWITPEGRFCDVRDATAPLMPGLSHLCARMQNGQVVAMALEFVFWEERLPECLVRLSSPLLPEQLSGLSKAEWTDRLTTTLRETQHQLAVDSIGRNAAKFAPLVRGGSGAGACYDWMRRSRAWVTGESLNVRHGEKLQ